MPHADPEEHRAYAREAAARSAARLRQIPRRASFSFGENFRLRSPEDILALLERTLEMVATDATIDSATTARCFVSIAKTASETLREHGLNQELAELNNRVAALRAEIDRELRAA